MKTSVGPILEQIKTGMKDIEAMKNVVRSQVEERVNTAIFQVKNYKENLERLEEKAKAVYEAQKSSNAVKDYVLPVLQNERTEIALDVIQNRLGAKKFGGMLARLRQDLITSNTTAGSAVSETITVKAVKNSDSSKASNTSGNTSSGKKKARTRKVNSDSGGVDARK